MRRLVALSAVLLLGACGGGKDEPTQCVSPRGDYRFRYAQTSGNCPAMADQVITLGNAPVVPANCTIDSNKSPNGCHSSGRLTCNQAEGVVYSSTSLSFDEDGRGGEGEMRFTITKANGVVACDGVYSVSFSRI